MSQAVGGAGSLVLLADRPLEWIVCFTLDFNFLLRVCFSSSCIVELSLHSSFVSVEDVIILKSDCILNVVQARDFCFSWGPPRALVGNALLHCCPAHFCFFLGIQPFTRPCSAWWDQSRISLHEDVKEQLSAPLLCPADLWPPSAWPSPLHLCLFLFCQPRLFCWFPAYLGFCSFQLWYILYYYYYFISIFMGLGWKDVSSSV